MSSAKENMKLAQSASALGAGLLGFGLGAKFGTDLRSFFLLLVIFSGGIIHVAGMYVLQIKYWTAKEGRIAKILWLTAWICLISLIVLVIYLLIK